MVKLYASIIFIGCSLFSLRVNGQRSILFPVASTQPDRLQAVAGYDKNDPIPPILLGANPAAFGGVAPYTYQWEPSEGLSFDFVASPTYYGNSTTTYMLHVTDARGCSSSDTVSIMYTGFDAVHSAALSVFPNPATAVLNVEIPAALQQQTFVYTVRDASGRIVATRSISAGTTSLVLNTDSWSKGRYMIQMSHAQQHYYQSIIIQ